VFDAWRFPASEIAPVPPFVTMAMQRADVIFGGRHESLGSVWKVNTAGGRLEAMEGDWLLRALDGKLYVYNDTAFRQTFVQHKDPWDRSESGFDVVTDASKPEAPKTFGIGEAVRRAKAGERVKRGHWTVPMSLIDHAGETVLFWLTARGESRAVTLSSDDLLAEDWEVA